MIQWVYERSNQTVAHRVIVATDSIEIAETVRGFGGEAVMTRSDHANGTQRIAEVAEQSDAELILLVQGDEPAIRPEAINQAIQPLLDEPKLEMSTLARRIVSHEDLFNPNIVKVVFNKKGDALYFSRSPIPFRKHPDMRRIFWPPDPNSQAYQHIGVYGYRKSFLLRYVREPVSALEETEGLEQLRALDMGARIRVALTEHPAVGVDVPEDIAKVEQLLTEEGR